MFRLEKIAALANMILLTSVSNKKIGKRPPSDYLNDAEKAAGGKLSDWLATNLISPEALEAARKDDYEAFLDARAKTIHDTMYGKTDWEPPVG